MSYSTPSNYLRCRKVEKAQVLFGFKSTHSEENAYSTWFQREYPGHEHLWDVSGTSGINIFGNQVYCAYRPRHPLIGVPPAWQLRFATNLSEEDFARFTQAVEAPEKERQLEAIRMVSEWLDREFQ